ncbi:MAG: TetR/AcrR family transcriptional regulator [Eubacteriales bacterium]
MKIKREAFVEVYITEALLLLMKKKDYKDISITEICQKAGVTRMSFYRNFESKEDILFRKVRDVTDTFLKESSISFKNDSSRDYFIKLFTHMERQKELCYALNKAGLIHIVKDEFDRVFLNVYCNIYDKYTSFFITGGIYNVFFLWLMNGCREKPDELADKISAVISKEGCEISNKA